MKYVVFLPFMFCAVYGAPKLRVIPHNLPPPQLMTLPSNATSIRTDISDSFQCDGRDYGYYADVDNDCQIFHVCLPITYSDGHNQTFRWSFICPEETVFNQEIFTCTRADESMDCSDSPRFYDLNRNFGNIEDETETESAHIEDHPEVSEVEQDIQVPTNTNAHVNMGRRSRKIKLDSKQ
ncbi:uncharacterized protein LOC123682901 [Harmonia axyridis]|uniref:uncharacterized protein LOC123682901 n=1 Tax=Harmonia axyridis TaxID=115357 RepID=UPI001E275D86|nr:uncharacterized protein LOC123682901 [Harmonia axyridis]